MALRNNLLNQILKQYHLKQGANESNSSYKVRIVYTVCGMMAYTSLLDEPRDENPTISIDNLKGRIKAILDAYSFLYPEVQEVFAELEEGDLEDYITNLFRDTGVVYHSPYRISMSVPHQALYQGIQFERGIAPENISLVSGLGFYSKPLTKIDDPSARSALMDMFNIDTQTLDQSLDAIVENASWIKCDIANQALEYLNPYHEKFHKYWIKETVQTPTIWLARRVKDGGAEYYLYKFSNDELEMSLLAPWMVESGYPTTISCALLKRFNHLPPIKYYVDGDLVHIALGYLLPKPELNLLMLYSWPDDMKRLRSPFRRSLNKDIFMALHDFLSHEGFSFTEAEL